VTGEPSTVPPAALGVDRVCKPGNQQRNYGEALHADILRLSAHGVRANADSLVSGSANIFPPKVSKKLATDPLHENLM